MGSIFLQNLQEKTQKLLLLINCNSTNGGMQ